MPILSNAWKRYKNTQVRIDEDGIVHIGATARIAEIPTVVWDIMAELKSKEYVLIDFAECKSQLSEVLRYNTAHVFVTPDGGVFFNRLLKCVLPKSDMNDLFVIRSSLFQDGTVLDSLRYTIFIQDGKVFFEEHDDHSVLDHLMDICGILEVDGNNYAVWVESAPNYKSGDFLTDRKTTPEPPMPNQEEFNTAMFSLDDQLSEMEAGEPLGQEVGTATDLLAGEDIEPEPEPDEPQESVITAVTEPAIKIDPTSPFERKETSIEEVVEEPSAPTPPPLKFEYQPPYFPPKKKVEAITPKKPEVIEWGGVSMVRFHDSVDKDDQMSGLRSHDIYHFAAGLSNAIMGKFLNDGYSPFSGKDGSVWAGKVMIKKEVLRPLGEGFQQVRPRKSDSTPRTIPSMMKGFTIQG